jgi:hypothetical protein
MYHTTTHKTRYTKRSTFIAMFTLYADVFKPRDGYTKLKAETCGVNAVGCLNVFSRFKPCKGYQ